MKSDLELFNQYKYRVQSRASVWVEQVNWLETIGKRERDWDYSQTWFYLKRKRDMTMFALRWA